MHSADLWSHFSEEFLSYANSTLKNVLFPGDNAMDVKCRLDLIEGIAVDLWKATPEHCTVQSHQDWDGCRYPGVESGSREVVP